MALDIIVAVITVLAIRQILVPPDLHGLLTRLDLLLITNGTGILAFVFVIFALRLGRMGRFTKPSVKEETLQS